MADIHNDEILDNLRSVDANGSLLDMLLEFEHVLDEQGLYGFKNWKLGEVSQGPSLSRHWMYVQLMYPYKKMPEPSGALRLQNIGCEIEFKKGTLNVPVDVRSREDLDEEGNPKIKKHVVWLIDVWMPRKFIDEFSDDKVKIGDDEIEVEEVNQAYDQGLDDETSIQGEE